MQTHTNLQTALILFKLLHFNITNKISLKCTIVYQKSFPYIFPEIQFQGSTIKTCKIKRSLSNFLETPSPQYIKQLQETLSNLIR